MDINISRGRRNRRDARCPTGHHYTCEVILVGAGSFAGAVSLLDSFEFGADEHPALELVCTNDYLAKTARSEAAFGALSVNRTVLSEDSPRRDRVTDQPPAGAKTTHHRLADDAGDAGTGDVAPMQSDSEPCTEPHQSVEYGYAISYNGPGGKRPE